HRETADRARERLVEAAALGDESVLDSYLETGAADPEVVVPALRKAVIAGAAHPVFAGTSLKNRGVRLLMNAVVDYLPSPLDVPPVEGVTPGTEEKVTRNPNPQIPLSALVYKVMGDEAHNRLFYARVYSGTLTRGTKVWNATSETDERVTRVYRMHSNRKEALDQVEAGDIVALVGPKRTRTGDTLCTRDHPLLLERIAFPEPVIAVAIEPRNQAALPDLEKALAELAVEDPTFGVRDDPETGQKIISGMGELHLQILVDRLAREFRVEARVGDPQVAYRESVRGAGTGAGKFDREIADKLHRAEVTLRLEPNGRTQGFEFASELAEGQVPPEAARWIEEAAADSTSSGPFAGYPLIDLRAVLTGVSLPGDAATEIAVRGATSDAFRLAAAAADPVLLEPVVRVEVLVPEEYTGEVLKDLNGRRAQVTGTETRSPAERIAATVALSRMFGYATDLRSLTRGRGTFSMEIAHFEPAEEAMKRFRGG
ncbi:MAG TPA: translation factor GTPase family protein, partial [bacterium]|nr:translation factor GTPase family protein [bacterium]